MHVVIFEGSHWKDFLPLSLSRAVFELVTGLSTLLEKQIRFLQPTRLSLWVRPELHDHCAMKIVPGLKIPTTINQPLDDQPALLVNGRTLLMRKFEHPEQDSVMVEEGDVIRCARVTDAGLSPADVMNRTDRWLKLLKLPQIAPQGRITESLWDLISWNEESLISDAAHFKGPRKSPVEGPFHLVNEKDVWLADEVKLGPGCVLDASKGPIVIDSHATIGANAVIEGPCYIGPQSAIAPLTYLRPGCSIGPVCKIGGEVSNTIVLGYSNKGHDGFVGDSYLGRWVNFGAGTVTSNLKNTYGEVSIKMGSREVLTGRKFLGSLIGDHTKTAIGTRLMTGTYIGFCCMLAGSNPAPRFMKSLTFWTDRGEERYRMDRAREVIERVFTRRHREWSHVDQQIMDYVEKVAPQVEV